MLTDSERDALWKFHCEAETSELARKGALAVPLRKFGDHYYAVSWAALYVASVCRLGFEMVEFNLGNPGSGEIVELPLIAIHETMLPMVMPRLLQPMAFVTVPEGQNPNMNPNMVYRNADGTPVAGPGSGVQA